VSVIEEARLLQPWFDRGRREGAQPRPGSARTLTDWFWDETTAGALLKQLRGALGEHEDGAMRIYAAMTLVPEAKLRPGHR
jgi:hypothetical protein